jgi:hypothetical protein
LAHADSITSNRPFSAHVSPGAISWKGGGGDAGGSGDGGSAGGAPGGGGDGARISAISTSGAVVDSTVASTASPSDSLSCDSTV